MLVVRAAWVVQPQAAPQAQAGRAVPATYVKYRMTGFEKDLRFGAWKVPLHVKGKGKQKGKLQLLD